MLHSSWFIHIIRAFLCKKGNPTHATSRRPTTATAATVLSATTAVWPTTSVPATAAVLSTAGSSAKEEEARTALCAPRYSPASVYHRCRRCCSHFKANKYHNDKHECS